MRRPPASSLVFPAAALLSLCLAAVTAAQEEAPREEAPQEEALHEEAPREEAPGEEAAEEEGVLEEGVLEAGSVDEIAEPLPIESAGLLRVRLGVGHLMTLPHQVARLAVARPNLARVQLISDREILFTGLKPGRTTLYLWLTDGRRLRYEFYVEPALDLLELVLRDLDPRITVEPRGASVILRGTVPEETRKAAIRHVRRLLPEGTRVINLMGRAVEELEEEEITADERLQTALSEIDRRIRVRRVQVGDAPQPDQDTYVLEGRVKSMAALVQAVTLAERQLGGTEVGVVPVEGGQALSGDPFAEGEPPVGLAAQISRGLNLMSPSGRVISFLQVDELPQILVSVRFLEIDRAKAKRLGVNFQIVGDKLTVGSFVGPQGQSGNLVVDFVDDALEISNALDFLETKNLTRSVAEPNVLTLSGEEATIVVGGQVPIPTTAVGNVSTVQGFRFQRFGVQLTIRPTLIEGDLVSLEVSPSISRRQAGLGSGNVPGFTFQTVRTTARVHAGQSLVLGGLLNFTDTFEEQRLPGVLGKIPLFRWRSRSRAETELLFVITPRFVSIDPAEPEPPVPPLDPETVELPPLDWPEDRDDWRDEFEPETTGFDGVPPSLRRVPDVALRPLGEAVEAPELEALREPVVVPEPSGEESQGEEPVGEETFGEDEAPRPGSEEWIDAQLPYHTVSPAAKPCLNLRPEPTLWFAPVDCLPPGTTLLVLETQDEWSRVVAPDGSEGWVASRYLGEPPGAADEDRED
jgi:Flp pilus assembly secretin CpaC